MNDFGNGILVVLGIGLLITVHELGHYLAARWIGARVEVFSLGFGPRLCGFRRGGTDYRLSLIPLGGYVAVAGADPGDLRFGRDERLVSKTVGQRALYYGAGVVMNLLFALVAFPIAFGSGVMFTAPQIGHVDPGSAAWEARLRPGDRILAVAGKPMYSFDNLIVEVALAGGGPVALDIERDGTPRTVLVTPHYRNAEGLYVLGIDPATEASPPVLSVRGNGPAAAAGVRDGDRLLAIDGISAIGDESQAFQRMVASPPPEKIALRLRRGEETLEVAVAPKVQTSRNPPLLGIRPLERIVAGIRRDLGVLQPGQLDLQRGDILLAVDGVPFRGPVADLGAVGGDVIHVVIERAGARLERSARITAEERRQFADHVAFETDGDHLVLQPMPGRAAEIAGMLPGDRLVAVDGTPVGNWDDLRSLVEKSGERPLRLDLRRTGAAFADSETDVRLVVAPSRNVDADYGFTPQIEPVRREVRADGLGDAVLKGCVCSLDLLKQLYVTLKRLVTGEVAAKNLGGIIQISRVTYQNAQWGISRLLYFLALLSINLAFINVLPIPILDGGYLLFLLIEKVKGSPVSTTVLSYSQILGLVLVLALVVFVTYNDILRLL